MSSLTQPAFSKYHLQHLLFPSRMLTIYRRLVHLYIYIMLPIYGVSTQSFHTEYSQEPFISSAPFLYCLQSLKLRRIVACLSIFHRNANSNCFFEFANCVIPLRDFAALTILLELNTSIQSKPLLEELAYRLPMFISSFSLLNSGTAFFSLSLFCLF